MKSVELYITVTECYVVFTTIFLFFLNLSVTCWLAVGRLSVTCRSTDGRQLTDSRPTGFLGSSSSQLPSFVIFTFTVRSAIAEWDLNETKPGGPFKEILDYDILVNCILLMEVYTLFDDYWSFLQSCCVCPQYIAIVIVIFQFIL